MRTGRHRNRGVLQTRRPYLRLNQFQGVRSSSRKENSALGTERRSQATLRCRAGAKSAYPAPSQGILTLFPFAIGRCVNASVHSESTRFWLRTD